MKVKKKSSTFKREFNSLLNKMSKAVTINVKSIPKSGIAQSCSGTDGCPNCTSGNWFEKNLNLLRVAKSATL